MQGVKNVLLKAQLTLWFNAHLLWYLRPLRIKNIAQKNRYKENFFYGRRGTLTHFALQDLMCEMEGGTGCYLYPCGAAAVTNAILSFVETGDHVLMTGAAYEPTQDFLQCDFEKNAY